MFTFFEKIPPNIHFRAAEEKDFEALYALWMQDHILSFMAFEKMSKDAFKPIFVRNK